MIDNATSDALTNKALEQFNITIQEIRKESPDGYINTGVIKNKKPVYDYYYNKYTWFSEEDYLKFREWAINYVTKKGYSIEDFNFWECLCGLREDYLPFYKKKEEV
jgi:hypothetical protein